LYSHKQISHYVASETTVLLTVHSYTDSVLQFQATVINSLVLPMCSDAKCTLTKNQYSTWFKRVTACWDKWTLI